MTSPWQSPPEPEHGGRRPLGLLLFFGMIAGLAGFTALLFWLFPGQNFTQMETADLVRILLILTLVSSSLLYIRQVKWATAARNVLLWLIVAIVLMLGFAFQDELIRIGQRLRGELLPGSGVQTGARELVIAEGAGNHYHVDGTVNGQRVRFMVDTGASDIVLSPADARRAGIDVDNLTYDRLYGTANGAGRGAAHVVGDLTVGPIRLTDVEVSVNQSEMGTSLLGMAFLRRIKSVRFEDRKMILQW